MKLNKSIFIVLGTICLFVSAAWPGQAQQSGQDESAQGLVTLRNLLDNSGYSYTKINDSVWEVPATGQNLEEFGIRITLVDDIVVFMYKIADRTALLSQDQLFVKLLELNHHFDSAKFSLSEEMLYVRIDIHLRLIDDQELKYLIGQTANVVDEAYPEIKPFISAVNPNSRKW